MPLQGPLGRTTSFGRADDLGHLGGGAPWHFALQRLGEIEDRPVGHRLAGTWDRGKCAEALGTVGPDPAIDGAPAHPHPFASRPGVVAGGELSHEHAALSSRQGVVDGFTDEGVAEERDLPLGVVHQSVLSFEAGSPTLTDHMGAG